MSDAPLDAAELHRRLRALDVLTDFRGDRIRFGFGIYQDEDDVDSLLERLAQLGNFIRGRQGAGPPGG